MVSRWVKVVLLGDLNVGKTSLRRCYMGLKFKSNYIRTLGADFTVKKIENLELQIWDLPGDDEFSFLRSGYYRNADVAIIVFDITNKSTFENIYYWVNDLTIVVDKNVQIILVGNKIDLRDENIEEVTSTDAEEYANELSKLLDHKIPYIETSALTGINVDNIFKFILEKEKKVYDKLSSDTQLN